MSEAPINPLYGWTCKDTEKIGLSDHDAVQVWRDLHRTIHTARTICDPLNEAERKLYSALTTRLAIQETMLFAVHGEASK